MGKLFLGIMVLTLGALVFGCGGSPDVLKTAPPAKPTDIGAAAGIPEGVSAFKTTHWIVKQNVSGENRVWALGMRVQGPKGTATQFDPKENIFFDQGRKHTFDINGNALHKIPSGEKAGEPGLPLIRYKVELDAATGHVMLYGYDVLKKDEREDPLKGGYVVVP